MRFLRRFVAGLRTLLHRAASDRDLDDEVGHFYAQAEAELVARGAAPQEARRAVRLRYGDAATAREEVRSHGWENVVEEVARDVRIAGRRLARSPGFTAVVVVTLALGIGAATAVFSVVRPVLFEPLGYPEADRIVAVADRTADGSALPVTFGTFLEIAARTRVFDALAVSRPWQPIATLGDRPRRLPGLRVSAGYFDVLGVAPAVGVGLDATEDRPGGARLVVLSDGLWRTAFGADPAVLGTSVRLDDRPYTVAGVMPADFHDASAPLVQVWTLLQYDPAPASFDTREWGHHLDMIARVTPATDADGARRALAEVAGETHAGHPRPAWAALDQGLGVRTLREAATASARPTMVALAAAVALLLAIACANVTVLLLSRGAGRAGELAMRVALGAGRGRLVRQLLVESLVLAGLGGALAIALTVAGAPALEALVPPGLRAAGGTGIDAGVFLFALASATLVGVGVGVVPAFASARTGLHARVRRMGRGGHRRTRQVLVATEVALALVLLVGTGLVMRSVRELFRIPVGLDTVGLTVLQVQTVGLADDDAVRAFFDRALAAVRAEPGVAEATLTSHLPLGGETATYGVSFEDVGDVGEIIGAADHYVVEPGYFATMGIPLLRGRDLDRADVAGAAAVVVVSASLARRAFGDGDPLGRRLHIGRTDLPWFTVVGVVGDVQQTSLASTETAAVYVAQPQWASTSRTRWIAARVEGDTGGVADRLRRAVASADPRQAVLRVDSMGDVVARSESRRRFVLAVLRPFGALALVLAAIGLYGVLARTVAERTRELGVRAALGASRRGIVALVVRQGLGLTLLGVVVGLPVAALVSRLLTSLLFGVSPLDPLTYAGTAALLGLVAASACTVPAFRAGNADPLDALRTE